MTKKSIGVAKQCAKQSKLVIAPTTSAFIDIDLIISLLKRSCQR